MKGPVTQAWTHEITMMQQSVLLGAIRGPDGLPKYGAVKMLVRWLRRSVLFSAIDGRVLSTPDEPGGGSFTGPSLEYSGRAWAEGMNEILGDYLRDIDAIPHHFQLHFMHAAEILGYKHPDRIIRDWWRQCYERLVHDMHLWPETEDQLDDRLGDTREGWLARADEATRA